MEIDSALEAMYWYTRAVAKKIGSSALMADAWHHRSDALSSVGSFVGIFGARLGFPVLDPIASVVICVFILKAAFDVFRDAISKMTDRACPDEVEDQMRQAVLAQDGVLGVDRLKTRLFGDRVYVEVEISADAQAPLVQAHEVATRVHDAMEDLPGNLPPDCQLHPSAVPVPPPDNRVRYPRYRYVPFVHFPASIAQLSDESPLAHLGLFHA